MTTFRINPHSLLAGRAAVEVISDDGTLLAMLYATDEQHLRVISKYLDDVEVDRKDDSIPVAEIRLRMP